MYKCRLIGLDISAVKFQGKKTGLQLEVWEKTAVFCSSASVGDPRSLFRKLVGCVGPEDGPWTRVGPLLEQRPRRRGVCPRLGLVTLG